MCADLSLSPVEGEDFDELGVASDGQERRGRVHRYGGHGSRGLAGERVERAHLEATRTLAAERWRGRRGREAAQERKLKVNVKGLQAARLFWLATAQRGADRPTRRRLSCPPRPRLGGRRSPRSRRPSRSRPRSGPKGARPRPRPGARASSRRCCGPAANGRRTSAARRRRTFQRRKSAWG